MDAPALAFPRPERVSGPITDKSYAGRPAPALADASALPRPCWPSLAVAGRRWPSLAVARRQTPTVGRVGRGMFHVERRLRLGDLV